MRYLAIGVLSLVTACKDNAGQPIDAPIVLDAPASDAPHAIDAPHATDAPHTTDGPPSDGGGAADAIHVTGTHHHYIVNTEQIPATATEATQDGLDLNGDGTVDNQFGRAMAAFAAQGFDVQGATTKAIQTGAILQLVDVQADSLTSGSGGFTLFSGADPVPEPCSSAGDTLCGHQLTGSGTFTIAAGSPDDPALAATITASVLTALPGQLGLESAELGAPAITLDLIGARVRVTLAADGLMTGVIGGGITSSDMTTKVYPQLAASLQLEVAKDCSALTSPPACGCVAGSEGATIIGLFDNSPADCHISAMEIANNSLIKSIFAPDITIDGQMVLSTGIGFTAVDATYTQP